PGRRGAPPLPFASLAQARAETASACAPAAEEPAGRAAAAGPCHGSLLPGTMSHRQHGYGQRQGRGGHHQQAQSPWSACKRCGHWEYDHKLPGLEWRCSCGALCPKKSKNNNGKGTGKGEELVQSLADVAARIQDLAVPPEAVQPQTPQKSPASLLADAAWCLEEAKKAYDKAFSAREEAHERLNEAAQTLSEKAALVVEAELKVQSLKPH
ncbi:unnamed protein product, partial [Prorocentrum cordatum]